MSGSDAIDLLLLAIVVGILVVSLYAPFGTYSAWRIYFADKRTRVDSRGRTVPDRSTILRLLAWISTIVTAAMLVASVLAIARIADRPIEQGGYVLGFAIVALGTIPFLIDRTMRRIRQMHGDGTPPPFSERD